MKYLLISFLLITSGVKAQKIIKDADGNYHSAPKPEDKKTSATYTDSKNIKYPVYINSKGKPYVLRTSKKTGKEYKQYFSDSSPVTP